MAAIKSKVNKSDEVRKLHASGVTSASEIMAKLKARGIKIAPAQVYQVISNKKKSKARAKSNGAAATLKTDVLDTAILFVRQAGGMGQARELLAKISQFSS